MLMHFAACSLQYHIKISDITYFIVIKYYSMNNSVMYFLWHLLRIDLLVSMIQMF